MQIRIHKQGIQEILFIRSRLVQATMSQSSSKPGFRPLETDGSNFLLWKANMTQYLISKSLQFTIVSQDSFPEREEQRKARHDDITQAHYSTSADYSPTLRSTATLAIRLRLQESLPPRHL